MRIFVRDFRQLGMCISGIRAIAKIHDLDFALFLKEGIDIEKIKHIDDSNIRMAIAHVQNRHHQKEY